jgi:hypothetical protein
MRASQSEAEPAGVPARAKQAGESQEIWALVGTACWTAMHVGGPRSWGQRIVFADRGPFSQVTAYGSGSSILSEVKPPTGEPDAGDPPVRFGGRGGRVHNRSSLPLYQISPLQGEGGDKPLPYVQNA